MEAIVTAYILGVASFYLWCWFGMPVPFLERTPVEERVD